jgi:hypothetical protein
MKSRFAVVAFGFLAVGNPVRAQTAPAVDSVMRAIRLEAFDNSQLRALAQPLMDSIGPRLTGSTGLTRASEWVVAVYDRWGIPVRSEQYGTARNWRRSTLHVDLVAPHVRSLEGLLMTYSAGTTTPIDGGVITYPAHLSGAAFEAWLPQAQGKFVALSLPEPTCRPDDSWQRYAPEAFDRMQRERAAALNE